MEVRVAILAAVLAAGCTDEPVLFLSTEGLASLVLITSSGDDARVEAFDLAASDPIRRAPPAGVATLFAIGYQAPLSALGLTAGDVRLDARGGPLPAGDRHARLDDGGWVDLSIAPEEVRRVRVAASDPCAVFVIDSQQLALAEGERMTYAVEIDDDSALFATSQGRFYRARVGDAEHLTELSTTTPARAAFRTIDGELWLAGDGGQLWRGRLDSTGFSEAPRVPFTPTVIDGAHDGAPFELFAVSAQLAVAHFDGRQWREVRAATGAPAEPFRPRIAWAEPGLAVLVGVGTSSVVEVSREGGQRRVNLELPPRSSKDGPWEVRYIGGRGAVVGTLYNVLYVREDGAFTRMPEPPVTPRADVLVDLGGRAIMAGGQNGAFAQLRGQDDFCEPLRWPTGAETYAAARVGAGFVFTSTAGHQLARVTIVDRRR